MSNRIIFLLVVASAVSIFSLWLVWKDGSSYVAMATRDDTTADTTLTARPIGRAEFVKADSFAVSQDSLVREQGFTVLPDADEFFPPEIDAFFACAKLNYNAKTGERKPWTGDVFVRGKIFSCRECWDGSQKYDVGTVPAGGAFDITISTDDSPQSADSSVDSFSLSGGSVVEWEETDIPIWTVPDSLAGKVVVSNSMPDSGDVPYLAKINDSTFAWLWLPGTRVRSNVDMSKK